jgi:very-short-patch-repair endonuclease
MSWIVLTRSDLRARGFTSRRITAAVRAGDLLRARRNHYLHPEAPPSLVRAVRVGGRLGCVSLLAARGVFVFDSSRLHVHMERGDSRMRAATAPRALPPRRSRDEMLHWQAFLEPPWLGHVHVLDALVQAARCQAPRFMIATLDSALHLGLIDDSQLAELVSALPRRFRPLFPLVDSRAESGTETLVRLMLLGLGCKVEVQVTFQGIGRVDLLVDGWLVIECDSRAHHSSWAQQRKDHARDLALAARGFAVLRIAAEDILYRPDAVLAALRGLVTHRSPSNGR